LAKSMGDVIKEADLLKKVGYFKGAVVLLLWYVYFSLLWVNGNSGWSLKQFPNKEVCTRDWLFSEKVVSHADLEEVTKNIMKLDIDKEEE
nr:UvrD-like helicase, ATP-binding domain, P-loop containing nucleoside triphosphate hydrolase [Tanacetum cinerariifolium]